MIPNYVIVDWEPVGTVVKIIYNPITRTNKRHKTNVYHNEVSILLSTGIKTK